MNLTTFRGKTLLHAGAVALACLVASPWGGDARADGYPAEDLDWTIAFGPGGGNDIMARTLIDIITKYDLYPNDISAENRKGGSGAVGWGYLYSKSGSDYDISTTSGSFITTPLQADLPWKPADFVPVALLATDDLVLMVNGTSEIDTLEEFIESAKKTPPIIGGTGTVNVDFIVPKILSKKAGFEFDYVSFNSMGEQTTALLSDALDAMTGNPAEVIGLIESGDMKAIAFSGEKTPKVLGDIPTLAEAGYDVGVSMPRGLILAPGASKEAQDWWIATMKTVVETPEWDEYISKNQLTENIKYGQAFEDFLGNTQNGFAEILREQGVIK